MKKESELKEKEMDLKLQMEKEMLEKRDEIFAEASKKEKLAVDTEKNGTKDSLGEEEKGERKDNS